MWGGRASILKMSVHMTAMNILNDEKKVSTIILCLPQKSQLWIGELRGQCSGKGGGLQILLLRR